MIEDSLFSHRGEFSQSTLDTLSTSSAGNEVLQAVVTVKAGDLDERLEFKILEEFVFSNSKTPRNASDWMDVGTAITEVKAINKKDKTVTEPWSTIVEEIRGAKKGITIRIVLVPGKVGQMGFYVKLAPFGVTNLVAKCQ